MVHPESSACGPGYAVGVFARFNFLGDLPCGEVELGLCVGGDAGDPGELVAGLGQDFFRVCGRVDGADYFHGGDVDDGELVQSGNGDEEELAVVGGSGTVGDAWERDPLGDLVGAGVNGGEARLGLIGGEDPAVVGGDGDALGVVGDGEDGEELAVGNIEYGDGAGADVGGVAKLAVVRECEHVRLGLAGGDGANDFEGLGIDDGDGVVELSGDVEQAVFGSEDGHVGAYAVAEVEAADDFLGCNVDDDEASAVGAGLADAGVAVNGNVGEAAVG